MKNSEENSELDKVYESIKASAETTQKVMKFVNWMTTISLAYLGFTITLFIDIKLRGDLPFKYLAASVLLTILISVLLGFYCKFDYEGGMLASSIWEAKHRVSEILSKQKKGMYMDSKTLEVLSEVDKAYNDMTDGIPEHEYGKPPIRSIVGQIISLGLGFILLSIYFGLYLFATK